MKLYARRFATVFAFVSCTLPAAAQTPSAPEETDRPPLVEGEAPLSTKSTQPLELHPSPNDLGALVESSELIFDGVVTSATTATPEGHRVLVTSYRFAVDEWLKGGVSDEEITLRSLGGELGDGRGMTVGQSLKLTEGRRYLIFVRPGGAGMLLPFERVFQIFEDGSIVADENGRIVTALVDGLLAVRSRAETASLSFLPPPPPGEDQLEKRLRPPDGWQPSAGERPRDKTPVDQQAEPLSAERLLRFISAATGRQRAPRLKSEQTPYEGALIPPKFRWCGRIRGAQNYFAWLPDDDNWQWWGDCSVNWNTLVADNPNGDDWLIGFFTSGGAPIRNRAPVANDGDNHTGVPSDAQMTAGGYGGPWSSFGANGLNFTWYAFGTCTEIIENDTFVNPAIANNEVQFRKSMTHEMGHALGQSTNGAGGHEDRTFAIMYPGTFRQPPNYASLWYGRADDMFGVRDFLTTSNSIWPNSWVFETWTDMATWSQTHDNHGASGNLVMTSLSSFVANPGDVISVTGIQVENRGNLSATNVDLRFYLSTNSIISNSDVEIGVAHWNTFPAHGVWTNGTWNVTIPASTPPGSYHIGWILTLNESERSTANNTAIMRRDHNNNFSLRQITILGQPDLIVDPPAVSPMTVDTAAPLGISTTVRNQGSSSSASTTLRYLRSTNATISLFDVEIGTDFVSSLSAGGSSNESITVNAPAPGNYWIGACVDSVGGESSTTNNCSAGAPITVVAPAVSIFSDGFETGNLSAWSSVIQ